MAISITITVTLTIDDGDDDEDYIIALCSLHMNNSLFGGRVHVISSVMNVATRTIDCKPSAPSHNYVVDNDNVTHAISWLPLPKHIEAETKWTPFRRRHFQVHFREWKYLNSDYNFNEVCF